MAVAITGFSSLIVIFRGSSADWSAQDYVGLAYVLSWSVGCIFLSLLPIVLVEFGLAVAFAARVGLFALVAYMVGVVAMLTVARRGIDRENVARAVGGPGVVRLIVGNRGMALLASVIVSAPLAAAFGLLPGPRHAWYAAAIVLLMVHATAELAVFVVHTARQVGAE